MRSSGAIEYITPLQSATESSTTPKSVMKTTVGRAGAAVCAMSRPVGDAEQQNQSEKKLRQAMAVHSFAIGSRALVQPDTPNWKCL